jgi:ubiquinone/menaquinone biosynthesis C-methylase UbiE
MKTAAAVPDINALKTRMKAVWMSCDFGEIARYTTTEAEGFVDRLHLQPGMRLLDVACGTGNVSLPAVRAGATVTGVDIATNLLAAAKARAEADGVSVQFDEGDVEDLPYRDAEFDAVVSMFGAMFAPRPRQAAAEMARVCRPGGLIALANWTPEGFVGKTVHVTSHFAPPPPGLASPVLWGDEQVARERFGDRAGSFAASRRELLFDYPFGPADSVQFHRNYLGPIAAAFARLDADGQQRLAEAMTQLYSDHNEGDDNHTIIRGEYLEIRVERA